MSLLPGLSPSLGVLRSCGDVTQRLTVTWVGVGYGDLGGLFQPEWVCDCVVLWLRLEETIEITKSSHEGEDTSTNYQQSG